MIHESRSACPARDDTPSATRRNASSSDDFPDRAGPKNTTRGVVRAAMAAAGDTALE
jgi:hypothetical protein